MSSHTQDFTEANRAFFNDLATKYEAKPWQQKLALQITSYLQANLESIGILSQPHPITLLDYACGTGMISRALGPSVDSIRAIDLSPKMIERFNELAEESNIPSVHQARAVEGDLLADPSPAADDLNGPDFHGFSIAAVGLGAHHFHDPSKAIGRLAQRLKPGGILMIVDFVEDEQGDWVASDADKTMHKRGFSQGEMREMMERQGLREFGWMVLPERSEIRFHEDKPMYRTGFMARATKPS